MTDFLPPGPATPRPVVILASSSPRRKELLNTWAIPFVAIDPEGDEIESHPDPMELVLRNAGLKAAAVRAAMSDPETIRSTAGDTDPLHWLNTYHLAGPVRYLLVGVDTVVVHDGHVMGKPNDSRESTRMVRRLSGRSHEVVGGLHLSWWDQPETGMEEVAKTRVTFRPLSDVEIDWYVSTGEGSDKAGAYGIQGLGGCLVERIEGCYFNVVGFPVALFIRCLARLELELATLRRA